MAVDEQFLVGMIKLPSRSTVFEHFVAKMLENDLEFRPLEACRRRLFAQLLQSLPMFRHDESNSHPRSVTEN